MSAARSIEMNTEFPWVYRSPESTYDDLAIFPPLQYIQSNLCFIAGELLYVSGQKENRLVNEWSGKPFKGEFWILEPLSPPDMSHYARTLQNFERATREEIIAFIEEDFYKMRAKIRDKVIALL
jgi:hypothetical protein